MTLPSYPELNRIALLRPSPQIMLGEELYWTEKRDGSQMRIALVNGVVKIATHHQEGASEQFQDYFKQTEQANSVMELLRDTNGYCVNPTANFNIGAVVFGELLSKGKSPARFEHHDKYEFVIFDIWSAKDNRFLSYNGVYSYAYHYGIPVVECWAISRHITLDDLYAYRDTMLVLAKERGREGVVLKSYHSQIFAKEKLDTPVIHKVDIDDGQVRLPALPESEVLGAIAKVQADLGEAFLDKKIAMPLIAKYIGEEMVKHLCGKPIHSLFSYYQQYLEGLSSGTTTEL